MIAQQKWVVAETFWSSSSQYHRANKLEWENLNEQNGANCSV